MIIDRLYTYVFIEKGGWTHYKQTPRANPANFVNKHGKKLGTLICSARARTVRPQAADSPPLCREYHRASHQAADRPALRADRPPLCRGHRHGSC